MTRPVYLYKSGSRLAYAVVVGVGRVANCDCDAPKKRLKYHRKTCASYYNHTLRYVMSPLERIKSQFVSADKIHSFSEVTK